MVHNEPPIFSLSYSIMGFHFVKSLTGAASSSTNPLYSKVENLAGRSSSSATDIDRSVQLE